MKNVLLLTNIYPMNDKSYDGTPVCHFFVKEWIKMGYNVRVVHFESLFLRIFYIIGRLFNSYIQAKTGCVAYTKTPRKPQRYSIDGVQVLFVPIFKLIPHSNFSLNRIYRAFNFVCDELEKESFIPDIITGHFILPQLQMVHLMKKKYPNSKTCMVLHSSGESMPTIYPNYKYLMESIDVLGFRSVAFKNKFEQLFGKQKNEFLCYSGIPYEYIQPINRSFSSGVTKFVFVGSLYKLKCVEDTIKALSMVFPSGGYSFDIVGDGAERKSLTSLVNNLKINDYVTFHGQLKREDAQKVVRKADCFIMVSAHEAFGLVYVEAMAKGCIIIATKGQGIDGVIIDGYNGFLCEAENSIELAEVINHIRSLSPNQLNTISDNAIETAKKMTDYQVAYDYIKAIDN